MNPWIFPPNSVNKFKIHLHDTDYDTIYETHPNE